MPSALPFLRRYFTFGSNKNNRVFCRVTIPIARQPDLNGGFQRTKRYDRQYRAAQSLGPEPGTYGWRVHEAEGAVVDRRASMFTVELRTIEAGVSETIPAPCGAGIAGFNYDNGW